MAILRELLNAAEIAEIQEHNKYVHQVNIEKYITEMSVKDLLKISRILIGTEYGDKVPACFLPAKALEILYFRAYNKGLPIT